MECEQKNTVNIEILRSNRSGTQESQRIIKEVDGLLRSRGSLCVDTTIRDLPKPLQDHVTLIRICEVDPDRTVKYVDLSLVSPRYHLYRVDASGPGMEQLSEGDEEVSAATHWVLPAVEFEDLWESLIYDSDIKDQLLRFVQTTMLYADRAINKTLISWNKVVLLHGPPGTGKTTLCKALAQKLSIRLDKRYKFAQLVEINSHSLFSKWFSESGKLVQKMFDRIVELAEEHESLVVVLIDEVESLTRARASTSSHADPSDAVRVVNAVLTQLDSINKYPNVLVVTTSNISGTIDLAFVDRADIKQYIGYPSRPAVYQIYLSCISELKRTGIISDSENLFTLRELQATNMITSETTRTSLLLWEICGKSEGFSGRTLRKLPFLAHALYAGSFTSISLVQFLSALDQAVEKQRQDREDVGKD